MYVHAQFKDNRKRPLVRYTPEIGRVSKKYEGQSYILVLHTAILYPTFY